MKFDIEQTVISQYGNSATISQLVQNMDGYIRPDADIDNFLSYVWNVETAQGFGLDIWGRIVNVSREILSNPVYYLSDDAFRALILLKALSNISRATAPAINQLLLNWLGAGSRAYVMDLGNMEMLYQFEFILEAFQIVIVTGSGIFLRPAGVGAILVTTEYPVFGFSEMGTTWAAPFGQAPFISPEDVYAVE